MMDVRLALQASKVVPLTFDVMTHRKAVLVMILVTLMWSIAGVVSRQLETARGFEMTFWRSAFNALALVVLLFRRRETLDAEEWGAMKG